MCDAYLGLTPAMIEQMHVDQILLLICDKEMLKSGDRTITCSPSEALARGFIESLPQASYLGAIRQRIAEKKKASRSKKEARRGSDKTRCDEMAKD